MVDIETMSLKHNAVIASIGACYFDIETGEIGKQFYTTVDMETCQTQGLVIDAGTVKFWMEQNDVARLALFTPPIKHIYGALFGFREFFAEDSYLWSHATFDSVVFANAYDSIEQHTPWHYRNTRDLRTLKAVAEMMGCSDVEKPKPEIAHHALYDAISQAKYASNLYAAIKEKTVERS